MDEVHGIQANGEPSLEDRIRTELVARGWQPRVEDGYVIVGQETCLVASFETDFDGALTDFLTVVRERELAAAAEEADDFATRSHRLRPPAGDPYTRWWGATEPGKGYAGQGGEPIWFRSG